MGWFNNCVTAALPEATSGIMEQRVTFCAAGAVVDKQDGSNGYGQANATPGSIMGSAFFALVFFTSPAAGGIPLSFFGSGHQLLKESFGFAGFSAFGWGG